MNPLARWLARRRVDRELVEEMAAHIAERIDQLRDEGQSAEEARANALRQFGNVTLEKERSREAWGWNALEQFAQDIRFGWRVLTKTPGFTITAVLVLALGIGMNTAMFSAVKVVLLSALPYPNPDRIVDLRQSNKAGGLMNVSRLDFEDWRAQTRTMQYLATFSGGEATLAGDFTARRVRMAPVGTGFFEVMATQAAMGRTFGPHEQKPGGTPAAVLGYELSQEIFGEGATAIGKAVRLNGMVFTVIGIMPPKFDFPSRTQLWLPNDFFVDDSARSAHNYHVVGRLRPNVSVGAAQADMNVVAARLANAYIDDKDTGIRVVSLAERLVGDVRPALLVLQGAVTLVLLIACVNISNLQLARATARRKELSLRSALGAARSRLIRQVLTESVLLSAAGGLAGLLLSAVGVLILRHTAPPNIPRMANIGLDIGVLGFTATLSICSGLLFGVLPALVSSKADVNDALKQGAGKGEGAPHLKRWGNALVVGQVGLAIVLLAGAGLMLKSYWKLAHVRTGLKSDGVFVSDLSWPASPDGNSVDGKRVARVAAEMLARIEKLPGVEAVALIHGLPLGDAPDGSFEIEGRPLPADPHQYPDSYYRLATANYCKAFGLPILKGRSFTPADDRSNEQVAIVNQSFEKQFFPGGAAIGQRIRFFGFDQKPQFMTIIGVIPDVRTLGLKRPAEADVFADYFQHADSTMDTTLVVRGAVGNQAAVKSIVTSLNRDTAVDFQSMDGLISGTISRERFQTVLLGLFAGCALLLAVVGVYGLLSYAVTRRTSELGIRIALGADRGAVLRLVLSQGTMLVSMGLIFGLLGALLATRTLGALLFQVKTSDPEALVAVAGLFALAALLGCYLPARRATKIDPAVALRQE